MRRLCSLLTLLTLATGWRVPLRSSVVRRSHRVALHSPRHRSLRCSILDEFTEEAENSWFSRFLPKKDAEAETRRLVQKMRISEQPVLFTTDDEFSDRAGDFDFDRWAAHRSSSRYSRLVLGIFFGKTTQRIAPVVLLVGLFSAFVFAYNDVFLPATQLISIRSRYPELSLPLEPFELTAPVLGLLLVFRTDTAYNRFKEGSQTAWEITASMRTYMRRLVAFTSTAAFSEEEKDAAADLVASASRLHGLMMQSYLRGASRQTASPADAAALQEAQEEVLRKALGVRAEGGGKDGGAAAAALPTASAVGGSIKLTPYMCLTALTLGVSQRLSPLTDQEQIALDDCLSSVSTNLAKCEEILSTPIPLGYTRSSVRFLWVWITLLPFALSRTFSDFSVGTWWEDKPVAELPVLLVAMLLISFIFLSIEDIAVQIEEPFAILPLEVQHKWLLRDAGETRSLMDWYRSKQAGAPPPGDD